MARGKRQFKNISGGYIGVMTITSRGEERSVALEPDATIFLSEEEIELTRDAPATPEANPFIGQPYEIRDPETDHVTESGVRPFLQEVHIERQGPPLPTEHARRDARLGDEVGVTNLPQPKLAPTGSFAAGEETGI